MINDFLTEQIKNSLPYLPTPEQRKLIGMLADFLLYPTPDSVFLLTGYAGTGKSSIIGTFVKVINQLQFKTVLLAPTGRAAKVFASYAGHPAFTIHKKIYRQRAFSGDYDNFSIIDNLHKDTLFIVDEASMISNSTSESLMQGSGGLLDDLVEYVYSGERCALVLLGDEAQLPPVGAANSPALDANHLKGYGLAVSSFNLQQVVRQSSESGILYNATRLRQQMEKTPLPTPLLRTKGFSDISHLSGNDLIEAISSAYNREGIDHTIVITRSNKRANLFNAGIRNQVLWREDELSPNDLILITKNNYFWCKEYEEIDFIANGDMARVVKIVRKQELYGFRFADLILYLPDYNLEMEAKVILDTLTTEAPALTQEMNFRLFSQVMDDYQNIRQKSARLKQVKGDPFFNALQIKYGYAVTCHKAQGGEWKNVFLDVGLISSNYQGADLHRWLYTSLTRSTGHLYLVNLNNVFREKGEADSE